MNYLPFTVTKVIHDEKIERSLTYHRRRNGAFVPQPALMPDPIGLLFSQIHSAIDRVVARTIQAIFHAVPAKQEAGTRNLTVERKPQPLTSRVAKQVHTEAIPTETEKNNVNGYRSHQIFT